MFPLLNIRNDEALVHIHVVSTVNYLCIFMIKVTQAVDLALLVERLQDERAAVALNIFLNRKSGEESIQELQQFNRNNMNISRFNLMNVSKNRFSIRSFTIASKCYKQL